MRAHPRIAPPERRSAIRSNCGEPAPKAQRAGMFIVTECKKYFSLAPSEGERVGVRGQCVDTPECSDEAINYRLVTSSPTY